jgi:hypothetical protein
MSPIKLAIIALGTAASCCSPRRAREVRRRRARARRPCGSGWCDERGGGHKDHLQPAHRRADTASDGRQDHRSRGDTCWHKWRGSDLQLGNCRVELKHVDHGAVWLRRDPGQRDQNVARTPAQKSRRRPVPRRRQGRSRADGRAAGTVPARHDPCVVRYSAAVVTAVAG